MNNTQEFLLSVIKTSKSKRVFYTIKKNSFNKIFFFYQKDSIFKVVLTIEKK